MLAGCWQRLGAASHPAGYPPGMERGDKQVALLREYLAAREWPVRVGTYDRYGGNGMSVELAPPPTAEQLAELQEHFGETFEFTVVRAHLDGD